MKISTFLATVADVKNGKTKIVIKFDSEKIERDELANLNELVNHNVKVTVEYMPVVEDPEDEGTEYSVNGRGEVSVAPGQTNLEDYLNTPKEETFN